MAKDKGENRVGKKYKKTVQVDLTDDEIAKKEKRVVVLENKVEKAKEKMKPFKQEVKELRDEIGVLCHDVDAGTEDREVYVYDEFVFSKNEVLVKRTDDDKLVEKRTMTAEEREEELDLPDADAPSAN